MKKQPNVLWLFTDQHRAQSMSCAGDPNIETPHLDRLAAEGIRFEQAYSNSPICSPSRACIYTGLYASSHGAFALHVPVKPGLTMIQQVFKDLGYRTSHYGKWHMSGGAAPSHFVSPYFRPGWDDWKGWENSNEPFATEYSEGGFPLPLLTLKGYQTDALTDLTLDFIKDQTSDKPWFHVVSIEPPHGPNTPPEAYSEPFKDHTFTYRDNVPEGFFDDPKNKKDLIGYYGQIKNVDHNIGRILAALEAEDQLDKTIIMYFSDHGDLMGSHGRRNKSLPYSESSQIPLIVRYPEWIKAGQVSKAPISTVDFLPTLLGLLGQEAPSYAQGKDLSKVFCGLEDGLDQEVLIQFERNFYGVPNEALIYRCLVTRQWMYIYYLASGDRELYDMTNDPYQKNNLAVDQPSTSNERVIEVMHDKLVSKLAAIGDDFFHRETLEL